MNHKRPPVIAGNWKMNGTSEMVRQFSESILNNVWDENLKQCEIIVCPPAPLIPFFCENASQTAFVVGGQDCHSSESGAYTGDVSALMLKDVGCNSVIVGHSERRISYNEINSTVKLKASAAIKAGLTAIVCVGETQDQKNDGETVEIVTTQVLESIPESASNVDTMIAYEPIWAIGTGKIPKINEIANVHNAIRGAVAKSKGAEVAERIRILYGGSVKPDNVAEILSIDDVDGALVGGASLSSNDFWSLCTNAAKLFAMLSRKV